MRPASWLVLAALGLSCGGGYQPRCCTPTVISRGATYETTFTGDGGVPTRVRWVVLPTGEAQLSFLRGGDELVQQLPASAP